MRPDPVVYQVYPRSFQDSNGDGTGDLPGITSRLDHLTWLGVDALWLSPITPSPNADWGYDVSAYDDVHPDLGTLEDFDALQRAVHERDLALLLDLVPCHTSIEHPWFRERHELYLTTEQRTPPNNWIATFGGSAWSEDPHGPGLYLHSFYPEQPDLDWRHPDVPRLVGDGLRFWRARGADGFRLDAIDRLVKDAQLRDDEPAGRAGSSPSVLPHEGEHGTLRHTRSRAQPEAAAAVAALREAAGADAWLVGEVYLPSAELGPYLPHLDAAFSFELYHAPLTASRVRAAVEGARAAGKPAWVLSNHDFPRLATRFGRERALVATLLVLTLPGPAFVYQGDELALEDGPGAGPGRPPRDRFGRDPHRHPMPWTAERPHRGFTAPGAEPWLPVADAESVEEQRERAGSPLRFTREVLALRRELGPELEFVDAGDDDLLVYRRGTDTYVALNLGDGPTGLPPRLTHGERLLTTPDGRGVVVRA